MLQHVLSQTPYSDTHGTRCIDVDAEMIVPRLFKNIAHNPVVMQLLSQHEDSGEPLSAGQINEIINGTCVRGGGVCKHYSGEPLSADQINAYITANRYMYALPTLEKIVLASFDLEIYINE